jgi:serine protease AprX
MTANTISILRALIRKDAALVKGPLVFCYVAIAASLFFKLQLLPRLDPSQYHLPEESFVGAFCLLMLGFLIYGVQVQSFWQDSVTDSSAFMVTRPVNRMLILTSKLLVFYVLMLGPFGLAIGGLVSSSVRQYPVVLATWCVAIFTLYHVFFIPAVILPTSRHFFMAIGGCLALGIGMASFLGSRQLGLVPRVEFAEDYQYAYLFDALFAVYVLLSLGAMFTYCRWRLYRWPLGFIAAGLLLTFGLFFRIEAYDLQGYRKVYRISRVQKFMDARWKNLAGIDLRQHPEYPATFWFNDQTVWPSADRMPSGMEPGILLTNAMNPGLGIHSLHQRGITGKGVCVGIIDQPLYLGHPEYAGKIAAYHDVGCNSESSMHGPGVTSLLAGENCGTAPGARIYYVATPSWLGDAEYFARALEWLVQTNQHLPEAKKIRVVSVSAAPSGRGSPFKKNQASWDRAVEKAEQAGMLVLDCSWEHGFIGPAFFQAMDREAVSNCVPGVLGHDIKSSLQRRLFVPNSPRTTAEHYRSEQAGYQYTGRGGLSWSIPYCAGVLALGWQVNPELTGPEMRELLFQSAYQTESRLLVIDPPAFIQLVQARLKRGG